jgi:hypothetical protein
MKKILFIAALFVATGLLHAQVKVSPICLPPQSGSASFVAAPLAQSINDLKIVRINYHFMLRTNGTGNFTETTDGNGRSTYNGYMHANDLTQWMNDNSNYNTPQNIPAGNTVPVIQKKYKYVNDAVYFWRDDNSFNFHQPDYWTIGKDKDIVLNVFLSYNNTPNTNSGYASDVDANSKVKYTENCGIWQHYVNTINTVGLALHGPGFTIQHEIGHLLTLNHTVMWNNGDPCPTSCGGGVNSACDDFCADTPTANQIMTLPSNNCTIHPKGPWGSGNTLHRSNNLMDYSGDNVLTPCQINNIHANYQGGMRSYLSCDAVSRNLSLCDIGYPKVSYFGKDVTIGCATTSATVDNTENLKLYYSNFVELNNFEVSSNAQFEVVLEPVCTF